MIPVLNANRANFRCISTLLNSCFAPRGMETCGHHRPPRWVPSNSNERNFSLAVEYRALPSPTGEATIGFPGPRHSRTNQEGAMAEPVPGTPPSLRPPPKDRLDSWKEIAAYLSRDVTTVQRWEKREGMPVHRHLHDRMGSVYAFSSELDAWMQSRSEQNSAGAAASAAGDSAVSDSPSAAPPQGMAN